MFSDLLPFAGLHHANNAQIYQDPISRLCEILQPEEVRGTAVNVFRSLVNEITLAPQNGELSIALRGDLGVDLRFAVKSKAPTSSRRSRLCTTCFRRNRWSRERAQTPPVGGWLESQNVRGTTGGGIASVVGCGGRI
ncbi:hypothetical protein [uncultured Marivita sp.]|uniref:hypothetical protein n=1 Tax=uncultured Marivita sp. TaxID=888080 RepID=UPI0026144C73|nr:hypothetical protein [uncultured Marivita sp.]